MRPVDGEESSDDRCPPTPLHPLPPSAGFVLSGNIAKGVAFASLVDANPFAEWDNVPKMGLIQLVTVAAGLELAQEQWETDGGELGQQPWFKPKGGTNPDRAAELRLTELKNGRLAMIGIAGFYAAETIPGSVPLLETGKSMLF